ncbi:substrate-binding domain-containing protein [Ramlibacter humi]|uniref:LysR family transcriptional regulator n=1 Tax=Ramlibacter humi TaxID=2530451 RepID=A0A4Z0BX14_9BURK|nr:substrate-binding domain-containing protein [Ramlibacter humi]TFZ03876.1 LysR family transcriptional regulator [Ramlibacter humi]
MRKVELSYSFGAAVSEVPRIRNPLMDLLEAVRSAGSITGAAEALGMSYRHVWGELKRWEAELGRDLIVWCKGQRAQLTPFADRLLWAERLAQARLAPQLESMHAELERALAIAFDDHAQVQTLFASHDDALSLLRGHAAATSRLHLDIQFCGSVDAISALNEGRCTVAGFHARGRAPAGSPTQKAYQPLLTPGEHKLIGFAERTQGLMVRAGNPLRLDSLGALVAREARFVNRPLGAGTRLLLDDLLLESGIPAAAITGYRNEQPSHSAVAQAIASGEADAGMGIEAAARRHGLDFVPLASEHYYLVCLRSALDERPTQLLRQVLQDESWRAMLSAIPGYKPWRSGEVLSLKQCLPWWNLPPKRATRAA